MALHLLKQKIIACANMFPITSFYTWEGELREENEEVLLLKTREELFEKVRQEVERVHSYSVPCITKIAVEPNSAYARWLDGQVAHK